MSADRPSEPEPPQRVHDASGGELARAVAHAYRDVRPRTPPRRPRRGSDRWVDRPGAGAGGQPQLSGPGPDERDPLRLDRLLSRLVAEHGWAADVAVHGVFSRWDDIVGAQLAEHCRPEQFVDGRLVVRADSTAWASQVRLLVPQLLSRLAAALGEGTVQRIDVRGPQQPSWRHGRFRVHGARGPRDTYG